MTPEVLSRKLASANPRERLEAARFLAQNAKTNHVPQIENALGIETVTWVRSALQRALQRARPSNQASAVAERSEMTVAQTAQIYSDALETTAKQIIHEIEPILGALRLSAETEVPDFADSDTARGLDRMDTLVTALSRLRRAASAPKVEEFALDQCIYAWVAEETGNSSIGVLRAGPQECIVEGDKGLVYLSFVNGLRNALDATEALTADDGKYPDITVNWGVTDIDIWVSIVDSGIGFRGHLVRAFEIGSTTKAGHLGMGLATAQQAMTSMGGNVRLIPAQRGARFEMRWSRSGA